MIKYFSNLYCTCIFYQKFDEVPVLLQNDFKEYWPSVIMLEFGDIETNELNEIFLKQIIEIGCRVRIPVL